MEKITYIPDWAKEAIIYHIYPFGFFNAPRYGKDDPAIVPRLAQIRDYYDHFAELGINVIQFGPIFESVRHGYDTTDFMTIDHRLGTNDLFRDIVAELHARNIRVIVDGVFNHVGRDYPSFKDIQTHRDKSWQKHWHHVNFSKDSPYNDGFDYANWEGHYSLVKLNLAQPDVKNHLFSVAKYWLQEIGIDGWRLDVAYMIPNTFWTEFRAICKAAKPDCLLIGEMIHGPYSQWISPTTLDAGTGYQVHKAIWNSLNTHNLYELKAILEQSFHPQWGLNKGVALVNFLGNHDLNRILSQLEEKAAIYPAVLLLFTLNGIPAIYYGEELGLLGKKTQYSDEPVRQPMPTPNFDLSNENRDLLTHFKRCIQLRKDHHALQYGNLISIYANDQVLAFLRQSSQETLLIIISNSNETISCTIPLWNLGMNGKNFREQLQQGGTDEFHVQNSTLVIPELHTRWGRILKLV